MSAVYTGMLDHVVDFNFAADPPTLSRHLLRTTQAAGPYPPQPFPEVIIGGKSYEELKLVFDMDVAYTLSRRTEQVTAEIVGPNIVVTTTVTYLIAQRLGKVSGRRTTAEYFGNSPLYYKYDYEQYHHWVTHQNRLYDYVINGDHLTTNQSDFDTYSDPDNWIDPANQQGLPAGVHSVPAGPGLSATVTITDLPQALSPFELGTQFLLTLGFDPDSGDPDNDVSAQTVDVPFRQFFAGWTIISPSDYVLDEDDAATAIATSRAVLDQIYNLDSDVNVVVETFPLP